MRNKKLKVLLLSSLIFAMSMPLQSFFVSAGSSKSYVGTENSVLDGHINAGDFIISGGVYGKENKIVFDETCKTNSKLISKTKVENLGSYGIEDMLNGSLTLDISDLVSDGAFSVCFGIESISSTAESKGSVELRFYKENGLNFAVYEHVGEYYFTVLESQQYDYIDYSFDIKIDFNVSTSGLMDLSINDNILLTDAVLHEGGNGYFGVFSKGKNTVTLSDLDVFGYKYNVTENVDYLETFDNGAYNSNFLYSKSSSSVLSPTNLSVENGELYFHNTAQAFVSTKYMYSNFELEFDLTHLQREAEYNENGDISALISNWFCIGFGVGTINQIPTTSLHPCVVFDGFDINNSDHTQPYEGIKRYILYNRSAAAADIKGMPFDYWSQDCNHTVDTNGKKDYETINIKFSVIDGIVNLYAKYETDSEYKLQYNYDLGETPEGYVRIYTWSSGQVHSKGLNYTPIANFAIDNLRITNKEYEGVKKVIEKIEFKSNYIAETSDYNYDTKPDESDLVENLLKASSKNNGCNSSIGVSSIFFITVIGVGLAVKKERR